MSIVIPDQCVTYIRWQRSRYTVAKFPNVDDVKRDFAERVEAQFKEMEPFLPDRVNSILDIGSGLAAIDVFLMRKYPGAKLALLDGDGAYLEAAGTPQEHGMGGWHPDGRMKPFSSRAHTEMFLRANGVIVDRWHDIGTKERMQADLIVSLASCGYHYPLNTYNFSGTCVMDVRDQTEQTIGGAARIICVSKKYKRLIWER